MQNANSSGGSTRTVHPSYADMEGNLGGYLIKIKTGPVAKYYCFDGVKEKVLWPQKFRWDVNEALAGDYGFGCFAPENGLEKLKFNEKTPIDV